VSRASKVIAATLVSGAVAALAAWVLVVTFAPDGNRWLAVGIGAVIGLGVAFLAGTVVEALVNTIIVGAGTAIGLFALGRLFPEAITPRVVVLGVCAGVCAGQLAMGIYNEFLAPPRE
jgi:hypothetical protein